MDREERRETSEVELIQRADRTNAFGGATIPRAIKAHFQVVAPSECGRQNTLISRTPLDPPIRSSFGGHYVEPTPDEFPQGSRRIPSGADELAPKWNGVSSRGCYWVLILNVHSDDVNTKHAQ